MADNSTDMSQVDMTTIVETSLESPSAVVQSTQHDSSASSAKSQVTHTEAVES